LSAALRYRGHSLIQSRNPLTSMRELLNELLMRLYSDEGTRIGPVVVIWELLEQAYVGWLIRWN
jgi:hypothetical protein